MIKEIDNRLRKLNKKMGVNIDLPNPTKNSLNTASAVTATLGSALLIVGIVASSKWCIAVGGISILSSGLQKIEAEYFE